jgi:Tfp pilus assembly protein PilO
MMVKGVVGVNDMDRRDSKWRLDKHIPVPMLFAVFVQTGAIVWFASQLTSRVETLEKQRIEEREQTASLPERITKLEVQQAYANQLLIDIRREMREAQGK